MLNESGAPPLTEAEFTASLEGIAQFESDPFLAVAVSGGPDSVALAILADRWAKARGGEIRALIVDHGLRPESADEASRVSGWLSARGIRSEVLRWSEEKPRSRIQEKARAARYRLLARWCHENGCLHLLTAHHREDQAETHLIRRRAGSGPEGLAGMSAVREIAGCRILRPLLGVPKARLLALLGALGQPYIDDPSNRNPAFERARLRAERPPDFAALYTEIGAFGEQRRNRERACDCLLAQSVTLHPAGFAICELPPLLSAPQEHFERALAALVASLGDAREYPVRHERITRLAERLRNFQMTRQTLSGCEFVRWRGRVAVMREIGRAERLSRVEPGTSLVWDGRFRVYLPESAPAALAVGYFGRSGARAPGRPRKLATDVPPFLHAVLPAVWDGEELVAVPYLGHRTRPEAQLPKVAFQPRSPLARAGFTVVRFGRHPIS